MAALIRHVIRMFASAPIIEEDPDFDLELYESFRHALFDIPKAVPKKA